MCPNRCKAWPLGKWDVDTNDTHVDDDDPTAVGTLTECEGCGVRWVVPF